MVPKKNSLRIIGGVWRSRRVEFADAPGIRPTPDRVRETLFNWLVDKIEGARCLDLFAGSGALGFEAASRGAAHLTLVDHDAGVIDMLKAQRRTLDARQVEIVHHESLAYIREASQPFDIVFLDPPFGTDLHQQAAQVLITRELLCPDGRLYIESPVGETPELPDALRCIREKTAGQVRYQLHELVA